MALRLVIVALFLLLPTACVTTRVVRLDTGQGTPLEYRPPISSRAVKVDEGAFEEALAGLVLEASLEAVGLSLDPLRESIAEAVEATLAPQLFYGLIGTGLVVWVILAANPEPVFTKAAAIVSAVMLIYLGVDALRFTR